MHIPDRPHAWFVGYCPVEQPRLAFAIVAEHGGSGGDLPAEIARGLCEYAAAPGTL
jgi:penicillin-binding protein 2